MIEQGDMLFGVVDPSLYYVIITVIAFIWVPILLFLKVKKGLREGKKKKFQVIHGGKVNRAS